VIFLTHPILCGALGEPFVFATSLGRDDIASLRWSKMSDVSAETIPGLLAANRRPFDGPYSLHSLSGDYANCGGNPLPEAVLPGNIHLGSKNSPHFWFIGPRKGETSCATWPIRAVNRMPSFPSRNSKSGFSRGPAFDGVPRTVTKPVEFHSIFQVLPGGSPLPFVFAKSRKKYGWVSVM